MGRTVSGGSNGIDPRWDDPSNYGSQRSHDGDGRYPPDWDARRETVMERQNYWCGRCGRYAGDVSGFHVHHLRHLSDGGQNHLGNLVGLCEDCHALMHPDNEELAGDWESAPMFPDPEADSRVAVVRQPVTDGESIDAGQHLSALETVTPPPEQNQLACSDACYALDADAARRASEAFDEVLADHGLELRSEARAIHVRAETPTGPAEGVSAHIDTEIGTWTKTLDERGRVTFEIPADADRASVKLGGERYGRVHVGCSFDHPEHRRDSHTVRLTPRRSTGDGQTVSTASAVGGLAMIALAAVGGWLYMGVDGAFGAAIGAALLYGAFEADAAD